MSSFEELMKFASDEMVNRFTFSIENYEKLTREDYIYVFITTFVISQNVSDDDYTPEALHDAVDDTSLCPSETIFFHKLIECNEPNETFIQALLNIYSQTKGLSKCQLGEPIKRCLDSSTELKFTDIDKK